MSRVALGVLLSMCLLVGCAQHRPGLDIRTPTAGAPILVTVGCLSPVRSGKNILFLTDKGGWFSGSEWHLIEIDPFSNRLVADIPIGGAAEWGSGSQIAVNEEGIWIPIGREGFLRPPRIYKVDPETHQVTASILVVAFEWSAEEHLRVRVVAGPAGVWAYIPGHDVVYRIDAKRNIIVGTNTMPFSIRELVYGEGALWALDVRRIFSALGTGRNLFKINPNTLQVDARVEFDTEPLGFAAGAGSVWLPQWDPKAPVGVLSRVDPVNAKPRESITLGPGRIGPETIGGIAAGEDAVFTFGAIASYLMYLTEIDPATNSVKRLYTLEAYLGGLPEVLVTSTDLWVCTWGGLWRLKRF